jgi:hypothetical protein
MKAYQLSIHQHQAGVKRRGAGEIMNQTLISSAFALGLFFSSAVQSAPAATAGTTKAIPINACELLQGSEISQVIGAPVGAPARDDAGMEPNGSYSSSCVWEIAVANPTPPAAGAPLNGKSFVILHAMQWPRGSGLAHTFLDSFWVAAADGDIPAAPEPRRFGDGALWWGDGLAVRRYDVSFGISVFFPGSKANHTGVLEAQLAPHILGRIEKREVELDRQRPVG